MPGDMRDKIDPYLRPLYDALYDMMAPEQVDRKLESGEIEVAPLAFMRGRTLSNAYVILDEAQNATPVQMKMFLTRLGENARMVVTGDLSQIDLPRGVTSGLRHAIRTLNGIEGVAAEYLKAEDVVRHELVSRIVNAYDAAEAGPGPMIEKALEIDIKIEADAWVDELPQLVRLVDLSAAAAVAACDLECGNTELSILMTDDAEMSKLNREWRR